MTYMRSVGGDGLAQRSNSHIGQNAAVALLLCSLKSAQEFILSPQWKSERIAPMSASEPVAPKIWSTYHVAQPMSAFLDVF